MRGCDAGILLVSGFAWQAKTQGLQKMSDIAASPSRQVLTVEPGLYYPGLGGIRIEDVAAVTATGIRLLSRFEKRLEIETRREQGGRVFNPAFMTHRSAI